MREVPATLEHFHAIRAPAPQAEQLAAAPAWHRTALIDEGARAIVDADGVWFLGGTIDTGEGRADCWSLVSLECRHRFVAVHRLARAFLDQKAREYRRLELRADLRCPNADRWALLLGFDFECVLRRYYPDSDAHLFARIRRD
jgi:hypothetical protein